VLGPEWSRATSAALFMNGVEIKREQIRASAAAVPGLKHEFHWDVPKPRHDVWLVAVGTGPGIDKPFWPTAKPYQPTSPEFHPYVLALTAPIRLDADGSGHYDSPFEYATALVQAAHFDVAETVAELSRFDVATAEQAASLLRGHWTDQFDAKATEALHGAAPFVKEAFEQFIAEWKLTRAAGK
jgi:hypothetical protein